MARKLKTYTTSAGFFDLAVAAPSMKAALEAWGSKGNLFHQGFARESKDAKVVAATMAQPGVVLRRAVGSSGGYSEHAELPRNLPVGGKAIVPKAKKATPEPKPVKEKAVDDKAAQRASRAYEKEQERRDAERRKEDAAREKERARREQEIGAAEAALAEGARRHDAHVAKIETERKALDRRAEAEDQRWRKQKEALETALRKARSVSYLRAV